MSRTAFSLLAGALLCGSCNDAAIEPPQSLVGAKELPSARALARETIYITRGGGPYGGDALSYEWRPDNSVTFTHTFADPRGRGEVKGRETLSVSPEAAARARRLLWRVRPAELEGVEQDVRPLGCEPQGPHDFGEVAVGFIKEGDGVGLDEAEVGLFQLPVPASCNTPAAIEARRVVRRALQLLPRSSVAAEFDRSR